MTNKTDKEESFITLEQLIKKNDEFPANKKFFELLDKYKNGERNDFVKEWNGWVELDKNKDLLLDFSFFHFDINNYNIKEKFSILTKSNFWNFEDLYFPIIAFYESTFEGGVYFSRAIFKEHTDFNDVKFKGDTGFFRAIFEGATLFFDAAFEEDTTFLSVTLEEDTVFSGATFEGKVYFNIYCIKKDIALHETKFDSKAFFSTEFLSRANLSHAFIDINNINFYDDFEIEKIKKDPANYRVFRRYYTSKLDHDSERKCFALELESKFPFKIKIPKYKPKKRNIKNLYSKFYSFLMKKYPYKLKKLKKFCIKIKNIPLISYYLLKSIAHHSCRYIYKWTSNYGESIFIPIVYIFIIYELITVISGQNYLDIMQCNLDLLNYDIKKCPDGWYKIVGKSFTYIGLFLTGLALKNKFKIK